MIELCCGYLSELYINCVLLSYHIIVFSKSALCNCLNVKEFLAQNRRDI